jgi:hypothetical protein
MADCDKIEREIRKPYRYPYRLASGNASLPDHDLCHELIKAVEQDMKNDFDCPMIQFCDAIFDAVVEQPLLPFGSPGDGSLQSRHHFLRKLEEIKRSSGNSVGVKQGARSSERVYDELRFSTRPITIRQVQERFSEAFVFQLVDAFLSTTRDELMKKTGRGKSEQDHWESAVKESLKQPACDLLRPAFKAGDSKAVRAPRRRGSRKWNTAQLHDPVQVVKG